MIQRAEIAHRAQSPLERHGWAKALSKNPEIRDRGVNDLITAAVEKDRISQQLGRRSNPGLWHQIFDLVARIFFRQGRDLCWKVWKRFVDLVPIERFKRIGLEIMASRTYTVVTAHYA